MMVEASNLLPQLNTGKGTNTPEGALKAAQEYEAFFLSQFFNLMFEGIDTDGLLGGGHGEQMCRSMLIDQYSQLIVESGKGIGLAEEIAKQLLHEQAATNNSNNQSNTLRGYDVYRKRANQTHEQSDRDLAA